MASQNTLELQRFFASVLDVGVGHLRKQELLFLLGRKRLTTSIWVEVNDLWLDVGDGTPLLVGEAEGAWAFAYGKGLRVTQGSWFQDVRKRAELTID
jgi:hypothetical protein